MMKYIFDVREHQARYQAGKGLNQLHFVTHGNNKRECMHGFKFKLVFPEMK